MALDPQTAEEIPLETAAEVTRRRRQGLFFLGLAAGLVGFALAVQIGANANFVAGEMRLGGHQQGVLEAFRESCGIVALGVLALLAGFAEHTPTLSMGVAFNHVAAVTMPLIGAVLWRYAGYRYVFLIGAAAAAASVPAALLLPRHLGTDHAQGSGT